MTTMAQNSHPVQAAASRNLLRSRFATYDSNPGRGEAKNAVEGGSATKGRDKLVQNFRV